LYSSVHTHTHAHTRGDIVLSQNLP
jgi:hypothetical protein